MELGKYLDELKFEKKNGEAISFPKGETYLKIKGSTIKEVNFKDKDGKDKQKWIITTLEGVEYWAGKQVVGGLKEARSEGAKEVKIIRSGEGINTTYIVMPPEVVK